MRPRGVYEAVVYASDLEAATRFYRVAFSVDSLDGWLELLRELGVEIEQEKEWARGGAHSIYVRDPAGNSVELVEGDLCPR